MPLVIPTPDEVRRMGWRERQTWRERMGLVQVQAQQTRDVLMAGAVMDHARRWQARYGMDPDAGKHLEALEAAIRE